VFILKMDFVWEWTSYTKDGQLKWNRYNSSIMNILEAAYKQKKKKIVAFVSMDTSIIYLFEITHN